MNTPSRSDLSDRINQLMALGALVLAVLFALDSAQLVSHAVAGPLAVAELAVKVLGGLILALLLGLVGRKWWLARAGEASAVESFTADVVRRACTASWVVTLVLLTVFAERLLLGGPPAFVVDVVLATMLGAYAIAYFVIDREPGGETS